jgi:hypothetical protein
MGEECKVPYWRYDEAYKAIHSALSQIAAPSSGKRVTKIAFTWNPDGTLSTLKTYEGEELLFTLAFSWNEDGLLAEVART